MNNELWSHGWIKNLSHNVLDQEVDQTQKWIGSYVNFAQTPHYGKFDKINPPNSAQKQANLK